MQGRLWPRNDHERKAALEAGYDLDAILTIDDLVRSDDVFFAATGITDGELMKGVRFHSHGATTESLVMRSKSGTVRRVEARHNFSTRPRETRSGTKARRRATPCLWLTCASTANRTRCCTASAATLAGHVTRATQAARPVPAVTTAW